MKEILSAAQFEKALSDLVNRIALDIDKNKPGRIRVEETNFFN